ncbi:hypothetical protein DWB85_02510 [Seongchinamella sediminis]|uniref:Uncharacterized protein n=2 Tax=Seongchinamella sediminis TaxID=2283635 RepID=A0A3L7E1S6_9GAMM|nr:hypothetical protein DWB85_02510 [Seongchinamella sediminis]
MKQFLLALFVVSLSACGGSSSDNVSPGQVVVEVPGGGGGDDDDDVDGDGDSNGGGGGDFVRSAIPVALESAITPSGETANDGREIYDIDVTALPGGKLDPEGLLLGNDVIFRIKGGALSVSNG